MANKAKCAFGLTSVSYLGYRISNAGVEARWPQPASVRQLCGFLGLAGYYRRFVKHYASIASPLTSLLCKDKFVWTSDSTAASMALKHALTNTPILQLLNYEEKFFVETDTSELATSAVLSQLG